MPNDVRCWFCLLNFGVESMKMKVHTRRAKACAYDPIYFTTRYTFFSFARTIYVRLHCVYACIVIGLIWMSWIVVGFSLVRLIWTLRFSKLHIVFFIWRLYRLCAMPWHGNRCGNSAFSWGMCSAFHIYEHASRLAHLIGRLNCWTGVTWSSKYLLSICNLCVVGILTHTHMLVHQARQRTNHSKN